MANHKSTKKRALQTIKKSIANKARLADVRTTIKAVRAQITAKNKDAALKQLNTAKAKLAKLAAKSIIKKNAAARTTSRLSTQIGAL